MSETDELHQFDVTAESASSTKTIVETRDFAFAIDEPETLGGTDDGPNPVEYLLGSWAGCLNVVAHLVAREYGIELDGLEIEIQGDLNPEKFRGATTDERAGYQEIRVTIDAETDADEQTLDEWLEEVEKRCPVGDNIQNPTSTELSLARE